VVLDLASAIALGLAMAASPALGGTGLSFSIDEIAAEDWRLAGIGVEAVSEAPGAMQARIRLANLTLPGGHGELRDLLLHCDLEYGDDRAWHCASGRLDAAESPIAAQEAGWKGYFGGTGDWQIEIFELALGTGRGDLRITSRNGSWDARLRAYELPAERVAALAPTTALLPDDWGLRGRLSGTLRASGDANRFAGASAELLADRLNYADPSGRQAAEGLLVRTDAQIDRDAGGWRFEVTAQVPQGVVYSEPVFLDAGAGPLALGASGRWRDADGIVTFDAWTASLAGAVSLSGAGSLATADLAPLDLTVVARSDDAGGLYTRLLQPFVIGSVVDELDVSGRLGMVLHLDREGIEQLGMQVNGLSLSDRGDRFALRDATGSVAWDRDQAAPVSRLDIGGASLYRIPVDRFGIQVQFSADRLLLTEPVVLPVLDGEVALDAFELRGALQKGEAAQWQADASVRGISLARMTEALQWPAFSGRIDGQLRDMRYGDGRLALGGGLELKALGGSTTVRGLRIEDPLGGVPVLQADASLRGLDLESLTQTFSFGRIEGRLDGDLEGLRLVGWQPDGFDLHLYTPEGDRSRRRISQRAVQNLTELGSGVPAGLSSSLLSVFEEFNYSRIDIRILLQGDVAEIDGLARDEGGYYLVKGSGLPRIDVIGRNRRVAWKDLIGRLRQIRLEGARIE
jgi:hypothetical protein